MAASSLLDYFRMLKNFGPDTGSQPTGMTPPYLPSGGSSQSSGDDGDDQESQVQEPPRGAITVPRAQAPAPRTLPPTADANPSFLDEVLGPLSRQYQYPTQYGVPAADAPTPEMEAYKKQLDEYPVRPSPSWMRVFGTGALSFANAQKPDQITDVIGTNGKIQRTIRHGNYEPMNIEEAHKVLNMPYGQELKDYNDRLKARQTAATLERQTNVDKALAAQRYATAGQRAAAPVAKSRDQDIREAQVRVNAMSAQTKMRAEKHAEAMHDMSDSQKEQYRAQQRLSEQEAKDADAVLLAREKGEQARKTKGTHSADAGATANIPTQRIKGYQIRANEISQDHPDWEEFIDIDPNTGMVHVTPPGKHWLTGNPTGPDKKTYDNIINYLRTGSYAEDELAKPVPEQGAGGAAPPQARPPQSTTPAGAGGELSPQPNKTPNAPQKLSGQRQYVYDSKGNRFSLPVEQVNDYIKANPGYTTKPPVKR